MRQPIKWIRGELRSGEGVGRQGIEFVKRECYNGKKEICVATSLPSKGKFLRGWSFRELDNGQGFFPGRPLGWNFINCDTNHPLLSLKHFVLKMKYNSDHECFFVIFHTGSDAIYCTS